MIFVFGPVIFGQRKSPSWGPFSFSTSFHNLHNVSPLLYARGWNVHDYAEICLSFDIPKDYSQPSSSTFGTSVFSLQRRKTRRGTMLSSGWIGTKFLRPRISMPYPRWVDVKIITTFIATIGTFFHICGIEDWIILCCFHQRRKFPF